MNFCLQSRHLRDRRSEGKRTDADSCSRSADFRSLTACSASRCLRQSVKKEKRLPGTALQSRQLNSSPLCDSPWCFASSSEGQRRLLQHLNIDWLFGIWVQAGFICSCHNKRDTLVSGSAASTFVSKPRGPGFNGSCHQIMSRICYILQHQEPVAFDALPGVNSCISMGIDVFMPIITLVVRTVSLLKQQNFKLGSKTSWLAELKTHGKASAGANWQLNLSSQN